MEGIRGPAGSPGASKAGPEGIAFDPIADFAYVTLNGTNQVVAVDLRTRKVVGFGPVGAGPDGIASHPTCASTLLRGCRGRHASCSCCEDRATPVARSFFRAMFVFISHLTVPEADRSALERHFRERSRLVDGFPGFLYLQLLAPQGGSASHVFLTAWASREAFSEYMRSEAHGISHSRSRRRSWRAPRCVTRRSRC